jgi:hypothetical protein
MLRKLSVSNSRRDASLKAEREELSSEYVRPTRLKERFRG